ncbi:SRPBCC family protein [Streptomyces sp. NPDC049881]|uniref:SRPBCC family protein n=1 Tax=unclassified Streptomyces TaxID=2593676 RepID=UPI00341FE668
MASRPTLVRRTPETVWAFLADPANFARWVVGTQRSDPLDDRWPAVGAAMRYTMGFGPLRGTGRTVVRVSEPARRLELEAQTKGLGTARIALEIRPWGEQSLLIIDEHPLTGPGGILHNRLADAFLQVRHRRMLHNLTSLVESATEHESEASARQEA